MKKEHVQRKNNKNSKYGYEEYSIRKHDLNNQVDNKQEKIEINKIIYERNDKELNCQNKKNTIEKTLVLVLSLLLIFQILVRSSEMHNSWDIIETGLRAIDQNKSYEMICYQKTKEGRMSEDEVEKTISKINKQVSGKIVDKKYVEDGDMWIIYGYTEKLSNDTYIENKIINYSISVTYSKNSDVTSVYLATPVINVDF